jgi:hypothetical protein
MAYGLLTAYAKTREAGFSGQYNQSSQLFWKPLIIEVSIVGSIKFLSLLIQVTIFSTLLYLIGGYYVSVIADLINGTFNIDQHSGGFLFAPLFVLSIIVIALIINILQKYGIIEKNKNHSSKSS